MQKGSNFRDTSVRIEVLGQGASGTVYKMVHVPTLTIVAAKVCMRVRAFVFVRPTHSVCVSVCVSVFVTVCVCLCVRVCVCVCVGVFV